jgi:hypothetical protein
MSSELRELVELQHELSSLVHDRVILWSTLFSIGLEPFCRDRPAYPRPTGIMGMGMGISFCLVGTSRDIFPCPIQY